MDSHPILVEVLRGGAVESAHRGAVAIVDAEGQEHTRLGDIDRPVFPRSAIKILQALPLVESGAADRFALDDAELALSCASHGGEPQHADTAASMLAKAGVDFQVLECGAHWPYNDTATQALARRQQVPSALHNNCSGKHSGFVCVGCLMTDDGDHRGFLRGYVDRDHPVMREVTAAIATVTGYDLSRATAGIDGCSIPTFAVPLRHLAHGFARIGSGVGLRDGHARAARRLRAAVAAQPFMVAGTGRFDTRVMKALGERVYCKVGAEGVYCAALPELGLGVAIKIDDGNNARACEIVMAALIQRLLPLDDEEQRLIGGLCDVTLSNWNGIAVGRLRATGTVHGTA